MSLNKKYKTDKGLETEGIRVEYKEDGKVLAWFKCRRPGGRNDLFQKTMSKKFRENRQALQSDDSGQLEVRLFAEIYAEAVILDWGGEIEGPDGEIPAACTYDNIVWLLSEEAPDLFIDLQSRLQSRKSWQREDEAKNSEAASATS